MAIGLTFCTILYERAIRIYDMSVILQGLQDQDCAISSLNRFAKVVPGGYVIVLTNYKKICLFINHVSGPTITKTSLIQHNVTTASNTLHTLAVLEMF